MKSRLFWVWWISRWRLPSNSKSDHSSAPTAKRTVHEIGQAQSQRSPLIQSKLTHRVFTCYILAIMCIIHASRKRDVKKLTCTPEPSRGEREQHQYPCNLMYRIHTTY
ncbi:hypothetical protein IQ07DRAFT_587112 [Pyrenochaeta sp. DS3sAY3a]|nr:hypothetical protein IQ07DRAFT_587112 [Pyrenochaeta sp. DS3sAY3a]